MFAWLRRKVEAVVIEWNTQRMAAENRAFSEQWRREHGDKPFPLTPEERRRLKASRARLSPKDLKSLGMDTDIIADALAREDEPSIAPDKDS